MSDHEVKDIGMAAEGMDMSFANQFQAMVKLAQEGKDMTNDVFVLPENLDQRIAGIKLESMGLSIDNLSDEQVRYRDSYSGPAGKPWPRA